MSDRRARVAKRLLDIFGASTGLVFLSPLLTGIVLAEVALHGWPPVFTQRRPGKGGAIFTLIKFRTMNQRVDAAGDLLPDSERLTAFGRFLRASSLDELPELWNVLKGEMSLVGPRPLLIQYLPRYTPEQARRHDVLPGITGWAQINGRNSLSWEEKFALDVWYVDNWSLALDVKILIATFRSLFRPTGIAHGPYATMPEFLGYDGTAVPAPEYRVKEPSEPAPI